MQKKGKTQNSKDEQKQLYKKKKKGNKHLLVKVKLGGETDGTSLLVTTDAVDGLEGLGVGVDHAGSVAGDGGALLVVVSANLHTLDGLLGSLGLDSRNIPARPAVVGRAREIELTPCRAVAAERVLGDVLALSGSPATLGVVVKGNVAGLTGLEGDLESVVAVPASELSIGADLVPEGDSPGLGVATLELDDVLVLRGVLGGHFDDVATPRVTDVAGIEDGAAAAAGRGLAAKALTAVLAVGRVVEPFDGGGRGRRIGGRVGGGDGRNGSDVGSRRGSDLGSLFSSRRGSSGGLMATGKLVDPGLDNAVDGGIDHVTYRTLIMVMATLVAVQTRAGGGSSQRCEQDEGVLQLHCVLYKVYKRTVVVVG